MEIPFEFASKLLNLGDLIDNTFVKFLEKHMFEFFFIFVKFFVNLFRIPLTIPTEIDLKIHQPISLKILSGTPSVILGIFYGNFFFFNYFLIPLVEANLV